MLTMKKIKLVVGDIHFIHFLREESVKHIIPGAHVVSFMHVKIGKSCITGSKRHVGRLDG
jgi:hypothetical protein